MQLHSSAALNQLKKIIPDLKRSKVGACVFFKLSELKIQRDNKEHIVIASNILQDQLRKAQGEMLTFADGDILLIFHEPNNKLIHDCVYQIQYLFEDYFDPKSKTLSADNIIKIFLLKDDFNAFENICMDKLGSSANDNLEGGSHSMIAFIANRIEDNLSALNWSKMIKEKFIYTVNNQPSKVISEYVIDYLAIAKFSGDDFNIYYNSHLKGFIRDYLDLQLMIKMTEITNISMPLPLMLGLSMPTLKSDNFSDLSKVIKETTRRRIIISVDVPEVYADIGEFFEVRDMLLKLGYKLCLSGLDNLSFLYSDRKQLGFDMVKLNWQPNLFKQNYNELEVQLKNKIQTIGSSRVILSNCGSSKAIDLGESLGISLFQGE